MKSFALPGLAAITAIACCLGLPLLIGATGVVAATAWGGIGVLVAALIVAGIVWFRRSLPARGEGPSGQEDCCAPLAKEEGR